ncbi:phage baseplate protein [Pasteurellaceae bacterium HPA106]|uniref:GPW/gp25 family protein n=1 Tax=Spirabiliibacterium pneumoniae TaxID=221400 RepID=UPI001AAD0D45|nr:GPW/gp25 family protein [Spirabiliibacterium pneumoniae]MBE2896730.1 phage baseplate protein [Spirabiliibacterium pneumoniae]
MKTPVNTLTTHWQLAPQTDNVSVVQGVDDIHQCVATILTTIKGSDILRPEFGSDHVRYLDQPEDIAIPNMVREITTALNAWEKRIVIERVSVAGLAPHFTLTVMWYLQDDVYREIYQTAVNV